MTAFDPPDPPDSPDPDEPAFRRAFDRLAGPPPDLGAGWADLVARRVRPSRRAPRLAVAGVAAATVAFLAVVARPAPAPSPTTRPPAPVTTTTAVAPSVRPTVVPPSSAPAKTTATSPAPAATVAVAPGDDTAPAGGAAPAGPADEPGTTPPTTVRRSPGTVASPPGSSTPSAPSAPPSGPPSAPSAGAVQRVVLTGGTVSVRVRGGALADPVVTPDPGWTAELLEVRDDRLEVRFRSAGRSATFRIRADGDGGLRVDDRS